MLGGPGREEHGVEVVLAEHRLVVFIRPLAPVPPRPRLGHVAADVATSDDRGVRSALSGPRMQMGDPPTAHQTDPDRIRAVRRS